jgi:predicted porin
VIAWLAVSAATGASADIGSVTLFGRIAGGVESVEVDAPESSADIAARMRVSSYRTIFGFRGTETIGGYQAIWQLSASFPIDAASTGAFPLRDSRIGVAGPAGTLFAGNWYTPYALSFLRLDPFVLTTADCTAIIGNGNTSTGGNLDTTNAFTRRQQNSVHYYTPAWAGFSMRAAYGANEERSATRDPYLASISASWESDWLYLTAAREQHQDYQAADTRDRGTVAAIQFKRRGVSASLLYERLEYETPTGGLRRDAWYAALVVPTGPGSLQFAYSRSGDGKGSSTATIGGLRAGEETGARHATIGYEYPFSKRTRALAFYTRLANDARASYAFGSNSPGTVQGGVAKVVALGMRHDF